MKNKITVVILVSIIILLILLLIFQINSNDIENINVEKNDNEYVNTDFSYIVSTNSTENKSTAIYTFDETNKLISKRCIIECENNEEAQEIYDNIQNDETIKTLKIKENNVYYNEVLSFDSEINKQDVKNELDKISLNTTYIEY